MSTADTVADLERLRIALGDDRLSFVGYSYGTFLGASYADAYPDRVRAFVLDGPVDPTMDATEVALGQARGFERALDDFLADCSAHPGCAFHHDGDAARRVRRRSAPGRRRAPLAVADADGRAPEPDPLRRRGAPAAVPAAARRGLRSPRALRRRRARATRRRCSRSPTRSWVATPTDATTHALEAFWAVTCLDGPVIGDVDAAAALESARHRAWRRASARSSPTTACPVRCGRSRRSRRRGGSPRRVRHRILVVGTTRDPATPLVQARALSSCARPGSAPRGRRASSTPRSPPGTPASTER